MKNKNIYRITIFIILVCVSLFLFSSCIGPGIQDYRIELPNQYTLIRMNPRDRWLYRTNEWDLVIRDVTIEKFAYNDTYLFFEVREYYNDDLTENAEYTVEYITINLTTNEKENYESLEELSEGCDNMVPYEKWLPTDFSVVDWTDEEDKSKALLGFE